VSEFELGPLTFFIRYFLAELLFKAILLILCVSLKILYLSLSLSFLNLGGGWLKLLCWSNCCSSPLCAF